MFTTSLGRSKSHRESFSHRAGKATKRQRSFKEYTTSRKFNPQQQPSPQTSPSKSPTSSAPTSPNLNSAIITIAVGTSQRLFAAHEEILARSPYFASSLRAQFFEAPGRGIELPNEEPEIFSAVLEYLYKGDYSPKLTYNRKQSCWSLEDADGATAVGAGNENTISAPLAGGLILKDTMIYCSAHRYSLPELQRLALKKQGLQSGVQCSTILSSARYAYAHTPGSDSKLRAHYLALIIRSRSTFKRSGTMQMEMERGGTPLFFDLFVAMVNHLDDIAGGR